VFGPIADMTPDTSYPTAIGRMAGSAMINPAMMR
jgi:hypothetical protein